MAILTFYNPDTCEQDNQGELGILNLDHQFVPVMDDRTKSIDHRFLRLITSHGCDSLKVTVRSGTATFRKENRASGDGVPRLYWYAYKKLKGKLNKVYIGASDCLTDITIEKAVETVNKPKEVTQETCVTKKTKPIAPVVSVELAGNGKNPKHLQPNLIPVNEEIAMLQREVEHWKHCLKQQGDQNIILNEEIRSVQRDRLVIIKERDEALDKLKNAGLAVAIAQERIQELEATIARQADLITAIRERHEGLNELHKEALARIFQLECESSKREDDVAGYAYMYEEHSEKIFAYQSLIEKYRLLATGKDKRNHPRFAYMIDFLAEIDNLS